MAELLSPAGGWDSLVAAVQSGADAVYMGFGAYNARRSAKNFTEEEFAQAVRYCHLRGVKVYLTLNTLLTDRELPGAAELLHKASRLGADAVLIQDWGVWQLARQAAPELPLHASTQMSLHTLGGARRAAELGLTRVVLAPRAVPPGHCRHLPGLSGGGGGLCPRRSLYVLLRAVRPQRRYRRTQRQPGHLRSALPPALWGQCPGGGRPSSEPEGRQPLPLPTGAGGHGGGVPEAGRAHEAAGVRGGHHLHLPAAAG